MICKLTNFSSNFVGELVIFLKTIIIFAIEISFQSQGTKAMQIFLNAKIKKMSIVDKKVKIFLKK